MAFEVVAVSPRDLRARFAAAAGHEPLSALAPAAAGELETLLGEVDGFDELPGRWQAALLRAEAARAGARIDPGPCCGGHH